MTASLTIARIAFANSARAGNANKEAANSAGIADGTFILELGQFNHRL
jgi:hypothetical protein